MNVNNGMASKNMMQAIKVGLAGVAMLIASAAQASSIAYTSPDFKNIYTSPTGSGWCTSCSGLYEVSDEFTLASAATLTGVDFGIRDWYGSNHNIEVNVWDTSLTTNLFSQTSLFGSYSTVNTGQGVDIISLALSGPTLAAGSYRMSWYDPVNMALADYTGSSTTLQQSTPRISGTASTFSRNQGAAFQIYAADTVSSVPEPGSLALLGLGMTGLAFIRRRKAAR
ncbi:PEP-CTERM sorting domain-containing protein [Candidatus Contendibacter odensensis]|uniref:Ice-binding protein C-terminal domain-containing protein n=1 Tax=Candidatus Contendobacter odensis Run_B_J11 TaxID=1400861 RepID=A0A7U7G7S2_9GAMM|nr:PEP-CTERM sorting domain-containing protein [Candidatus Contendobacter odensis]CDH43228.1 exported hypothetical protein [Candidatus Contendobacter odensis Run_B_J11]